MVEPEQPDIPRPEEIRRALKRVLASEGLANSPRLRRFLTYLVEEELAGRGSAIRGKIVATDVYEKDLDENGSALNLVRVEARRLRRSLEDYYAQAGRDDPIRISVQTGGYRPAIERLAPAAPATSIPSPDMAPPPRASLRINPSALLAGALAAVLVVVVAFFGLRSTPKESEFVPLTDTAKLSALRERSITSVQAVNLAEQARSMFFPLFDTRRQALTLDAFRYVIDLDPGLAAGYAGAGQVLCLQSMLTRDPATSATLLSEARTMVDEAVSIGPTDGWAQASLAWVLAVEGDPAGALRRGRIAADLAPEDGHLLDLIGLVALVANDATLMAEVSDPDRPRTGNGRFAYNNIWGASQLMLQNYPNVVDAFSNAAERGHPVSPPSLFLLATAYQEMGRPDDARQAIEEMKATWPGFPFRAIATRFMMNSPATLEKVLGAIDLYVGN